MIDDDREMFPKIYSTPYQAKETKEDSIIIVPEKKNQADFVQI